MSPINEHLEITYKETVEVKAETARGILQETKGFVVCDLLLDPFDTDD